MGTRVDGPADGPEIGLVGEYLDRLAAHDVRGARELVLAALVAGGDGLTRVIDELLVPAMAEVGSRWYDGRWNAAQEHVASGITEGALSAASVRARSRRPPPDAPHVVLACPRGEDHVLPARFAAELLVEAGADVILLGPAVPDPDLAGFLAETRPCALVLSCTEPLALPGVRDATATAHEVGIPVLGGGTALGPDARRSRVLGADAWARGPAEAVPLLRAWRDRPPALAEAAPEDPEVAALGQLRDSFFDEVLAAVVRRTAAVAGYRERELQQARSDLRLIVSSLACAMLCADDLLFTDYVAWGRGLLDARGVQAVVLDESLAVIDNALGADFPRAHRLLSAARAAG